MTVISDATVLIALAHIGQLELLKQLWRVVVIPVAVREEIAKGYTGKVETEEAIRAGWVVVQAVQDRKAVDILTVNLGRGEAECLVLAKEIGADLLLLDERRARLAAERAGFAVVGVLGLLVQAAKESLLDTQRVPEMIDTLKQVGFRLGDGVIGEALRALTE